MIEVTVLAVLQGIAEFLPISSSGHLVIGQHLLGINAPGMRLDVFLHVGTLISIFAYYASTVFGILRRRDWKYVFKIAVSALPAVAVYFLFKDFISFCRHSHLSFRHSWESLFEAIIILKHFLGRSTTAIAMAKCRNYI